MKNVLLITAATLAASPALAGSVVFTPPAVAAVVAPVQEWTGPYAGIQVGYGSGELGGINVAGPISLDGMIYGAHVGYNFDLGDVVLGAEIDYNLSDITGSFDGDVNVPVLAHAKARVGFDMGKALVYGVGGMAYAEMDMFNGTSEFTDTGFFGGIGAEYMISDSWSAGAEYLFHSFDDFGGSGFDLDLQTIQARASFHF